MKLTYYPQAFNYLKYSVQNWLSTMKLPSAWSSVQFAFNFTWLNIFIVWNLDTSVNSNVVYANMDKNCFYVFLNVKIFLVLLNINYNSLMVMNWKQKCLKWFDIGKFVYKKSKWIWRTYMYFINHTLRIWNFFLKMYAYKPSVKICERF